jgi:hypothetical protein
MEWQVDVTAGVEETHPRTRGVSEGPVASLAVVATGGGQVEAQNKRLQIALEQTLGLFEQSSEWPDLIGFLSKMAKVLSSLYSPARCPDIPQKWLLSKRLAQCLNPALPSGVHQRVLEVYDIILSKSPASQLVHDLSLWSLGLFPFLSHASMSVKVPAV